jgi:hypothetical protein
MLAARAEAEARSRAKPDRLKLADDPREHAPREAVYCYFGA